jgi:hypothetical protein
MLEGESYLIFRKFERKQGTERGRVSRYCPSAYNALPFAFRSELTHAQGDKCADTYPHTCSYTLALTHLSAYTHIHTYTSLQCWTAPTVSCFRVRQQQGRSQWRLSRYALTQTPNLRVLPLLSGPLDVPIGCADVCELNCDENALALLSLPLLLLLPQTRQQTLSCQSVDDFCD